MDSTAIFGGGCFWCLEAVFQRLNGVKSLTSGYTGGEENTANYKAVCGGQSGHAEVIKIVFDPELISFKDLLLVFFNIHDPTTLNRQGNDVGTQYRSAIFYTTEMQKLEAEQFIKIEATQIWDDHIVTEVSPLVEFYPAEVYHQDYYNNNENQAYCTFVIKPKVDKLNNKFKALLKNEN